MQKILAPVVVIMLLLLASLSDMLPALWLLPQPEISVLSPVQGRRRGPPALAWVSGLLPPSEAALLEARIGVRQDARHDEAIA